VYRFNQWVNQIDEAKKSGCNCWTGYKRVPGTKPCEEGSCIKEERGLWDNIHAKQKRIKAGSGEKMRKPGSKGAPTDAALKASQNEEVELDEGKKLYRQEGSFEKWSNDAKEAGHTVIIPDRNKNPDHTHHAVNKDGKVVGKFFKATYVNNRKGHLQKEDVKLKNEEVETQFDLIEELVMDLAEQNNIDPESIWEEFEEISDEELLEAAVDAKGHKSSTGGLTQKGRAAYNAKGANLQAPVTTPPSKLKAGSKAANRRKSFCARMGGMEGPMKKPNGEPTRKALALRKWNC
jgi:hypothetical protein